jgi:hypothetical protein
MLASNGVSPTSCHRSNGKSGLGAVASSTAQMAWPLSQMLPSLTSKSKGGGNSSPLRRTKPYVMAPNSVGICSSPSNV